MPATVPPLVVLGPTAVVLVALFLVLWRERTSTRDARIAIVSGAVLSLWAVVATVLAYRGVFQPKDAESVPPVGINLVVVGWRPRRASHRNRRYRGRVVFDCPRNPARMNIDS